MERLVEESAIMRQLYRFTHSQYELDLATMASILVPDSKIVFDLSKHFPDFGRLDLSASELCTMLYEASAGFTSVQHTVTNAIVSFDNTDLTKANVKSFAQAYHCIESDSKVESLNVQVVWYVDLVKAQGEWLIAGIAMSRTIPLDNPGIYELAQTRRAAGISRQPLTNVPA